MYMDPDILENFEKRVQKTDSCWMYLGPPDSSGYGQTMVSGLSAHRLAYRLYVGPIPPGLVVRHKCDIRLCVNPAHLTVGTQKDNIQDAVAKGRMASGERNGKAKLSEKDVSEIRQLYQSGYTQQKLGKLYNVAHSTIGRILSSTTWKGSTQLPTTFDPHL